jgi:hypothetical protein
MFPIDGHVHFHEPKLVAPTLRAAAANFRHAMRGRQSCRGALLLTQARKESAFEWLRERTRVEEWSVAQDVEEPQTLRLETQDGASLAVIDGRQIRAARGLEVLALGTRERFRDGEPLADTVAAICASGALPVIPWGFGKWIGTRGRVVRSLLGEFDPARICLGDNGGRIGWLPEPAILRDGRCSGYRILPGTDPVWLSARRRPSGQRALALAAVRDPRITRIPALLRTPRRTRSLRPEQRADPDPSSGPR